MIIVERSHTVRNSNSSITKFRSKCGGVLEVVPVKIDVVSVFVIVSM